MDKSNYILSPQSLTILPTYKCTAACPSCSIECSPNVNSPVISIENIKKYIREARESFDTLKVVVFSGGECFLLGENLFKAIKYANELGLMTRCVTNGYWATSENVTRKKVEKLIDASITEMNFSTGDEHLRYVPIERILLASTICAENNIRTVVSVEGHKNAIFRGNNLIEHHIIKNFYENFPQKKQFLNILQNVWMSIHKENVIKQEDNMDRMSSNRTGVDRGCANVITNMVINPEEQLASCCGLTFENIPEMKIGSLKDNSIKSLYEKQLDDFMKIWIYVEGPEGIIEFAASKNKDINIPKDLYHICESCAYLYKNENIRKTIAEHYHEKIDDVLLKLTLKQEPVLQ